MAPLPRKKPLIFLPQLGQDEWSDGGEDPRQHGIAGVKQPAGVGGVFEVDATFQDRVFADAEVASDGGHCCVEDVASVQRTADDVAGNMYFVYVD